MTGQGQAYGAITIVNATATGIGCALAVDATTTATWDWTGDGLQVEGAPDDAVVQQVADLVRSRRPAPVANGAHVSIQCPWPPSRGLKTSSSAAAALVQAASRAAGQTATHQEMETLSVQACRQAGVTLTGALDDQVAAVRGGCHVTDNRAGRVLHSLPSPRLHVAIWVPDAAIRKDALRGVDVSGAAEGARQAIALAEDGQLAQALTLNGQAYFQAYSAAGLPVDARPVEVALASGALGAGLSGTGPAVAALFRAPSTLAEVPGGRWAWTKVAA